MKKITFTLLLCCITFAAFAQAGVPEKYQQLITVALEKAGNNAPQLSNALKEATPETKEAVAFLIAYMPERDLKTLTADYLLENVNLAYQARNRFAWAKSVPDSVFFNDVLPYASLNEERDAWRADFYARFAPYVEHCQTMAEAIKVLNKSIRDEVKVDYNTAREKPDQNPSESIRQGMASCSGLSILLTDAFRAVGIPSRIAGTASWHDNRGNHNWCEVWLDGKWYFTEYYPDELNRSWFLADAGKARADVRRYAIWASSFKPTGQSFPLVWDLKIDYVPAINVTQRYRNIYQQVNNAKLQDGNHVVLKVMMFKDGNSTSLSADRVAANVDVFCGKEQIGGGRTAGPTQDMNDVLEFVVEKNKTYTLNYFNKEGKWTGKEIEVAGKPTVVKLHL